MSTKEKLKTEMRVLVHRKKAQLKRLEAEMEDLRADLAEAGDDQGLLKVIGDDLEGIRAQVVGRLGELEQMGRSGLEELRGAADKALGELRNGIKSARRKLERG